MPSRTALLHAMVTSRRQSEEHGNQQRVQPAKVTCCLWGKYSGSAAAVSFFLNYNQTALHIQAGSCCPRDSAESSQESMGHRNCRELAAVSESTAALRHNRVSRAQPSHIPHLVRFSLNSPATCFSWEWELDRLRSSRKTLSELLIVSLF